jgi:aryl-alcohol dehydrogenase-like predicted oxidoreductase
VIVYSPAASGVLARARDLASLAAMTEKDRRLTSAEQILRLSVRLRAVADRIGTSMSALAIAWTLATDGVAGAICGARRPAQVQGWIEAGDVVLDAASLADIESIAVKPPGS